MTASSAIDRREKTALLVSGVILIVTAGYWVAQVLGVIEMLKLAYG